MSTLPRPRARRAALLLPLLLAAAPLSTADNTACAGDGMDWYIQMVGETPCSTYQQLRQICNPQFEVSVLSTSTPGDFCTDQLSSCCCNSISFALSMLCLNCQQNIGNGTGIDAGVGAYQIYLNGSYTGTTSCANPIWQGLPKDIQTAVCNEKLKIDNDIYTNGWGDGAWFYIYTRDTITKDNIVANNNSFTHCASTTVNTTAAGSSTPPHTSSSHTSTIPTGSSTSLPDTNTPSTKTKSTSSLAGGAIAGIAIGALVGIAAILGVVWLVRKRQARGQGGGRRAVLEEPLGGGGGAEGREMGAVDDRLVARSYTYGSPSASSGTNNAYPGAQSQSDYFGAGPAGAETASSAGVAGAGAFGMGGGAHGHGYNPYADHPAPGPTTPYRGFHTQQPSTSSSLPSQGTAGTGTGGNSGSGYGNGYGPAAAAYGGIAPSVSGSGTGSASSRGQGQGRGQAGPLPRKRASPGAAGAGAAAGAGSTRPRADSEEPFLEAEEAGAWGGAGGALTDERHRDAGPVSQVSLGRSPSGRLPPAYGEQFPPSEEE
ncbi:hypothetical protein B0H11DRAFT_2216449 [Mycena galericulata]|nr:hypothetical protein B0H11DRAFT_2216449 [Mycena galericulata]